MAFEPPFTQATQSIRQAAFNLQDLSASFFTNDLLEITDHHGVRMPTDRGTDQVISGFDIGHPIPQGFTGSVFEGLGAGGDRMDLRTPKVSYEKRSGLGGEHLLRPYKLHIADQKGRKPWRSPRHAAPAPVSAMMRFLPMRFARMICPRALLILWAPVWFRSSRLR